MPADHLVKILAERGLASRRACERMIRDGRVRVGGAVVKEPGTLVDARAEEVKLDDKPLPPRPPPMHVALHKPRACLTTRNDPDGRRTVFDLLEEPHPSLAAVGRLDWGTEGVLLITNDGELAYRLTHPSYSVPKTYLVKISSTPDQRKLTQLARGVKLEDGPTSPALVELVQSTGPSSWLLIQIHEGRNRIVRRMIEHIGHKVLKLKRVGFGGITLRGLDEGATRKLSAGELAHLRAQVRKQGEARLSISWEIRAAVAEALRLPAPPKEARNRPGDRDSEGRPYRKKGWARPKAKKPRPGAARKHDKPGEGGPRR